MQLLFCVGKVNVDAHLAKFYNKPINFWEFLSVEQNTMELVSLNVVNLFYRLGFVLENISSVRLGLIWRNLQLFWLPIRPWIQFSLFFVLSSISHLSLLSFFWLYFQFFNAV